MAELGRAKRMHGNTPTPLPLLCLTHHLQHAHIHTNIVSRLELVQADAATFVEEALTLLPYAEEAFQVG